MRSLSLVTLFLLTSTLCAAEPHPARVLEPGKLPDDARLKKPVDLDALVFNARHVLDAGRLARATP